MAIDALRIVTEITVSGASQSSTTASVMGKIDQILLNSTVSMTFDIKLVNADSEIVWEKTGLYIDVNETINDIRPNVIPRGKVTITISNPSDQTGVLTVTFIEKERS